MKKIAGLTALIVISLVSHGQTQKRHTASFDVGQGINFSFDEGAYRFKIGGFIQPSYNYEKAENGDAENTLSSRRSYFSISGEALKEKVAFLIQTDYSLTSPLLDAWIAYHLFDFVSIAVGQKQTFVNNREMMYNENMLQFADRSRLSASFSRTGREFGAFIEAKIGENFGISPKLALTSGDGRNSFGADSRDGDLGGMKIGGRLDVYPLGYFSEGNDRMSADLIHEDKLKLVAGIAAGRNKGASGVTGEGHGEFLLYDGAGNAKLPDYSQIYADLLLKYSGFSLLAEFVDASAKNFEGAFVDPERTALLAPQQVGEYLALGDAYHVQLGYVTRKGLSFDVRFNHINAEFQDNPNSFVRDQNSYTLGVSRYFYQNNLKIQASFSTINYAVEDRVTTADFLVQIAF